MRPPRESSGRAARTDRNRGDATAFLHGLDHAGFLHGLDHAGFLHGLDHAGFLRGFDHAGGQALAAVSFRPALPEAARWTEPGWPSGPFRPAVRARELRGGAVFPPHRGQRARALAILPGYEP
ncbi:hypothetical protein OHU11_37875 [Streptomyces sp. NBC_00257]|uniref:hypothetical protein n=1 Tax=unclassified Streptomyces TaxID=2593676 RepID=UPI002255E863|nr:MULTISPECIES: hypothetical protein [unclassified Streptomyces]MCX5433406.1 hypothetical protein [Streptomyces sp. NBC_00062]